MQRQCSGQARGCLLTVPARVTRASANGLVLTAEPERLLSSGLLSTFFDAVRSKVALQLVLWFRVPFLAMVTQGEILFLLGVVGDFLFRERPHTDLVPLLQACTSFRALHTHLQSYLDDTVRAVQRLAGAWRMGTSRVFFHIRVGTPARLAVRRGHCTDKITTSLSCRLSGTYPRRWWRGWSGLAAHTCWPATRVPFLPGMGTCKSKNSKHADGLQAIITFTTVLRS